ncbi:hypothetical protein [Streptomyces sp. NPDC048277]|uniref:hypothetical protein n=1 Tax=Streptomyces sp. NPDC048277 TaxID=3155027 RepID=UPI00340E2A63
MSSRTEARLAGPADVSSSEAAMSSAVVRYVRSPPSYQYVRAVSPEPTAVPPR